MMGISEAQYQAMLAENDELSADEQTDFIPTEAQEQMRLFGWIDAHRNKYPQLQCAFHVPNGEYRDKATAGKLKSMGVRGGVPDILILARSGEYAGCAIELKRSDKSNRPTPEQWAWINHLAFEGWYAQVCYGATEAIAEIQRYLNAEI